MDARDTQSALAGRRDMVLGILPVPAVRRRDEVPDAGPQDDAGPGATTTMAASGSGCDCDAAGARTDAPTGLLGLLLAAL